MAGGNIIPRRPERRSSECTTKKWLFQEEAVAGFLSADRTLLLVLSAPILFYRYCRRGAMNPNQAI